VTKHPNQVLQDLMRTSQGHDSSKLIGLDAQLLSGFLYNQDIGLFFRWPRRPSLQAGFIELYWMHAVITRKGRAC